MSVAELTLTSMLVSFAVAGVVAARRQPPRTTANHSALLDFMALFAQFHSASWTEWRHILARLTPEVREFYAIVGRGGGKSLIAALLACFFAAREYKRAPGEQVFVGIFAPDRKQAAITLRYIVGLLRSVPSLAALIKAQTKESVTLHTGVVIEVLSATIAAPRGRSYALVIIEEAAFLPQDQSANPDVELLRAVRPALARVPGSLLVVISSPYARRGVLWQAWQRYHNASPSHVVFVQRSTLDLNPTFDREAVATARAEDPAAAAAEYDAQFRCDVETFLTHESITAAVVHGRVELSPVGGLEVAAFVDPAGGSGADSFTMAIARCEPRGNRMVAVVVAVLEIRPPFSPERACAQCAAELQRYDIPSAVADRYAGDFPVDAFARHAISLAPSDRNKSEIYAEFLPLLNSGCVELLDHDRLKQQLAGLERRTTRGGRDSIDHAPGGHDDVANAVAGAVVEVLQPWARAGGVGQAVTDERQRGGVVKDPTDVRPSWTDFFHRGIRYTPRSSAISRERGLGTAKTYDSEGIDPMGRR